MITGALRYSIAKQLIELVCVTFRADGRLLFVRLIQAEAEESVSCATEAAGTRAAVMHLHTLRELVNTGRSVQAVATRDLHVDV